MIRDAKHFYLGVLGYLLVVLTACTALGLTPPQTFNQKLTYAYGSVTSVRLTAKDLLERDRITVKEAIDVQDKADLARQSLDTARIAGNSGDMTTAEGKLTAAQNIINLLQTFLKSKGTP